MANETAIGETDLEPEAARAEAAALALMDELGIAWKLYRHPPLFTVEDSQELRGDLPGAHVKNMFLKDKKDGLWLVSCLEERRIKIKHLEKTLGAPRMSFGKPELLWEALGVRPGAVTPLAVMTDREKGQVRAVMDATMMASELVNCHPLHNRATVALSGADLGRFIAACGHTAEIVDFDALDEAAAAE